MMIVGNPLLRICLLSAILLAPNMSGAASIVVADRYPVVGDATRIQLSDDSGRPIAGADIDVTYRPESRVERSMAVGTTDGAGAARWTPADVGVVTIRASWTDEAGNTGTAASSISVKFASPPPDGIIIMIIAGFLLLGGSVRHFVRLMRAPEQS